MENQMIEVLDYVNEGVCVIIIDDLIDKYVFVEKFFKKYGRFVFFDDEVLR